ncbi:LYR motif-containing protein 2 [Aplysia californica]|uniref:LYR motif-containing protein 2 n=1 Tax=Aplysia californica TaxID=6500 RepID=A0ABM0JDH9_APLCA|nr:LYR motif-containing protein 2 [Aplysia californica]
MSQLTLKQFMLRSEVLKLYRDLLRITFKVENPSYRKQLQEWIRSDFEMNRHHTEEEVIKMMVSRGKLSLREVEQAVLLAK